jgi:DNA-binding PadR family transcriptional regulator
MSLPHAILAVLATGPRHGRAVTRELSDLFDGIRPVNAGQVHAALERLTRHQHVTIVRCGVSATCHSAVRTYVLLPSGERELRRWLERARVEPAQRCGFGERLVVLHALRNMDGIARLVGARRARVTALRGVLVSDVRRARFLDADHADPTPAQVLALARAAALRLLAAEIAWLDDVERTLLPAAPHVTERIDASGA